MRGRMAMYAAALALAATACGSNGAAVITSFPRKTGATPTPTPLVSLSRYHPNIVSAQFTAQVNNPYFRHCCIG